MLRPDFPKRILTLRNLVVAHFDANDWREVGLMTGYSDAITKHDRLLRSLHWGNADYDGVALEMIQRIAEQSAAAFELFEQHAASKYGGGEYVSSTPVPVNQRTVTFAPNVFHLPDSLAVERDLVSIMMPFDAGFNPVHDAIRAAAAAAGMRSMRVDDIWNHSVIVQDIFALILKSQIVVVDFTGRNANVMYETGIAHTLGKHVVPISQSMDDVPFDMRHHRVLKYLPNAEGMTALLASLSEKLAHLRN